MMDAGPNIMVFGHLNLEGIEANVRTLRRWIGTRFADLGHTSSREEAKDKQYSAGAVEVE